MLKVTSRIFNFVFYANEHSLNETRPCLIRELGAWIGLNAPNPTLFHV